MPEPARLGEFDDAGAACVALEADGYCCVHGVLSPALSDAGLSYLRSTRRAARDLVEAGALDELYAYGNVKCRAHRQDLHLSLGGSTARRLLRATLDKVAPVLIETMGTDEATLVEFSSLHSHPGAASQPPHADTDQRCGRCLVTVFVALQDVAPEMGPTVVWPRSHLRPSSTSPEQVVARAAAATATDASTCRISTVYDAAATAAAAAHASPVRLPPLPQDSGGESAGGTLGLLGGWRGGVPALLAKGSALIMDSRLVHCGSANVGKNISEREGGGSDGAQSPLLPPPPSPPPPPPPGLPVGESAAGGVDDPVEGSSSCVGGGDGDESGGDRVLVYSSWLLPGATPDG